MMQGTRGAGAKSVWQKLRLGEMQWTHRIFGVVLRVVHPPQQQCVLWL